MNRKSFLMMGWAFLAVMFLSLSACKDDDDNPTPPDPLPGTEIGISNAEWTFSGEAGKYELMVAATVEWTVSSDADWIKLSVTSGSGNVVLGVNVSENNGSQRSGVITVKKAADNSVLMTFKIIQEAIGQVLHITSEDTIRDIPAAGKAVVIDVESNVDYTFDLEPWVKVAAAPSAAGVNTPFALTKSRITLNIAPNADITERSSAVVIKQGGKEAKRVVLYQLGTVYTDSLSVNIDLLPNGTTIEIPPLGGTLKLKTVSNIDYACTLTAWGNSKMDAESEAVVEADLAMMFDANFTFGSRQRGLMVTGGKVQKMFTLVQKPVDIQVSTAVKVPAMGNEAGYLKVLCPEGVIYRVSGNLPGIYHNDALDKPSENLLAFEIEKEKNLTTDDKIYQIGLEFCKGEAFDNTLVYPQRFFPLLQAGITPMAITWEGKTGDGNSVTVDSVGAAPMTIVVSAEGELEHTEDYSYTEGSAKWVTVTGPVEVDGENENLHYYQYVLSFQDNEQNDKLRQVNIQFALKGYEGINASMTITQKKYPLPPSISGNYGNPVKVKWDQDYTEENINAFNGGNCDILKKNAPDGATWEAEITEGDFKIYKAYTYVIVFGTTKNETGSEKTGKLLLTLKDQEGNILATGEVALIQETNPNGGGSGGEDPVVPTTPVTAIELVNPTLGINRENEQAVFAVSGGTGSFKVVNDIGDTPGWMSVQIFNGGPTGKQVIIKRTGGSQPGTFDFYIMPEEELFKAENISRYGKITLTVTNES